MPMSFVYRPKIRRSNIPFGPVRNTLVRRDISKTTIVTTEFWNAHLSAPIFEGGIIFAQKGYTWKMRWELGRHYLMTDMYNDKGLFIGRYWDVGSEIVRIDNDF